MTATGSLTAEELFRLDLPDRRAELVDGQLIVREPAGYRHGRIAAGLAARLKLHAESHDLGEVLAAETGFVLRREPDTVRAPDVAFIRRERLPEPEPVAFAELAPDLVIEVLSPDDRRGSVLDKVGDWLEAGVRLIWVVDPERRTARVYRQDDGVALLRESDILDGEDVLPGFTCPLGSIF